MLILCKLFIGSDLKAFFVIFSNDVTFTCETIKIVECIAKLSWKRYDKTVKLY